MAHDHGHAHGATSAGKLGLAIALNLLITAVEVLGGLASGSLSLLSDALHNLSDGVSLAVSWAALRLARRERSYRFTFGLKRTQILAAVLNAAVLIGICLFLFKEAYDRFAHPAPVATGLMVGVALVGLVANIAGTLLLREGAKENLNIRSSYLHLLSDVFSSVAVIVGGLAMGAWGAWWVDPLLTVAISLYVLKESLDIVREAVAVLLLCAPPRVSLPYLQREIEALPGVRNLHHVHLWCVDDADTHFEAHVEVEDMPVSATESLVERIEHLLHNRYEINHVTLQFEVDRCASKKLV
ncbi:MAG: cation diffusion facilitator family transporter [Deferrisomatales bacterium]